MADFVHSGIVALILKAVGALAPELLDKYADIRELVERSLDSDDQVPAGVKTQLLNALLEDGGPELVMSLGAACKDEQNAPLLFFLLNSSGPKGLVQKLQRFDEYFHSAHQLVVLSEGPKFLELAHTSRDKAPAPAADDLFLFGVISHLMQGMGCTGVKSEWLTYGDPALKQYGPRIWQDNDVPKAAYTQWVFRWDRAPARSSLPGLDEYLLSLAKAVRSREPASMRRQVEEIISHDLSRTWTVSEVAVLLRTSVRTLQRRLQNENIGFSRIVTEARVNQSARMLRESKSSLTEVGLMSGFADAAHFSREFKKLKGCPPSVYRDRLRLSQ